MAFPPTSEASSILTDEASTSNAVGDATGEGLVFSGTVAAVITTPNGRVISTHIRAISPSLIAGVPSASGSGGKSLASGCIGVTVTNVAKNLLGSTAYKYITVTSWCWTRSTRTITSQFDHYRLESVGSQQYWRGEVQYDAGFFTWVSGYSRSGYKHYRQGHFENCVLKYGCIASSYPSNTIEAHSDGTYKWSAIGT